MMAHLPGSGADVAALRRTLNLTQKVLSELLDIPVEQISDIENGKLEINRQTALALAYIRDRPSDYGSRPGDLVYHADDRVLGDLDCVGINAVPLTALYEDFDRVKLIADEFKRYPGVVQIWAMKAGDTLAPAGPHGILLGVEPSMPEDVRRRISHTLKAAPSGSVAVTPSELGVPLYQEDELAAHLAGLPNVVRTEVVYSLPHRIFVWLDAQGDDLPPHPLSGFVRQAAKEWARRYAPVSQSGLP